MYSSHDNTNFSAMETLVNSLSNIGSTKGINEKGAIEHKVDYLSDLHDIFVGINNFANHSRGFESNLLSLTNKLGKTSYHDQEYIKEIMLRMMAHTRDCRKDGMGRGSRAPTMLLFVEMYRHFPALREDLKNFLHPLCRHYGSLGDLNRLAEYVKKSDLSSVDKNTIVEWIVDMWVDLITSSKKLFDDEIKQTDLTAKHAPREKKQFDWLAKKIACKLFTGGDIAFKMKCYRKLINPINKTLDTTEIKMCDSGYSMIDYGKVPGRCLAKNRKAFLNVTKTGTVRSTDIDRVEGGDLYRDWLASLSGPSSKGAKGTSMFITELAHKLTYNNLKEDTVLFEAQWNDQVENLKQSAASYGLDLGEFFSNFVMLLDFSGSMQGEPMNLALAMAAFVGPLMKGPFKDKFISFESRPRFIDMSKGETISQKLNICARSPWGGSTDFAAAHRMILDIINQQANSGASKEMVTGMIPKFFLVVSDMQFDAASGRYGGKSWETVHESLVRMWSDVGLELYGEPFKMPTMIYWNARSNTSGMPVTSNTKDAVMVSGYSTSVLKSFMVHGIEALQKFTPWKNLEETLMHEWYNKAVEGQF